MSDYVSCPRCQGRGLIRLEDAAREQAHASVERSEQENRQRQMEQEMLDNKLAEMRERMAKRQRDLDALMRGGRRPQRAPDSS